MPALSKKLSHGEGAVIATAVTPVDKVVNGAGPTPHSLLERRQVEDWRRMIDVNLKGVLHGIAALPHMMTQKSGHILSISTAAGRKLRQGGTVYTATKPAARVSSEGLGVEMKPSHMRTAMIPRGAVQSELQLSVTAPDIAEGTDRFYAANAMPTDSFARVAFAISRPEEVDIDELLFRPTKQEL